MRPDSKVEQAHCRWRNRVLQHGGMDVVGRCGKRVGGCCDTACYSGNIERGHLHSKVVVEMVGYVSPLFLLPYLSCDIGVPGRRR
eukprot:10251613-Prorocentrum_lima.AAC.1